MVELLLLLLLATQTQAETAVAKQQQQQTYPQCEENRYGEQCQCHIPPPSVSSASISSSSSSDVGLAIRTNSFSKGDDTGDAVSRVVVLDPQRCGFQDGQRNVLVLHLFQPLNQFDTRFELGSEPRDEDECGTVVWRIVDDDANGSCMREWRGEWKRWSLRPQCGCHPRHTRTSSASSSAAAASGSAGSGPDNFECYLRVHTKMHLPALRARRLVRTDAQLLKFSVQVPRSVHATVSSDASVQQQRGSVAAASTTPASDEDAGLDSSQSADDGMLVWFIVVGALWGCTNPLLNRGSRDSTTTAASPHRIKKNFLAHTADLITRWRFVVPFALNQLGSVVYVSLLGRSKLSLAGPICNGLTFLFTAITARALGEQALSVRSVLGIMLVLTGVASLSH